MDETIKASIEENIEASQNFIAQFTYELLVKWGVGEKSANFVNMLVLFALLIVAVYVIHFLIFKGLRMFLKFIAKKRSRGYIQKLIDHRFSHAVAMIIPLIIITQSLPVVFEFHPRLLKLMVGLTKLLSTLLFIRILMIIVRAVADKLKENTTFAQRPIESYIGVLRIIIYFFGAIIIYSQFTGKNPAAFFGVLGAASAILLLMFKDTIMGFVASIQVATNDMVRIGDWVTMPDFGADGDVLEISLTTVKIQNFDKTITTIPTHNLISSSFINWRGMQEYGGRRIKRSLIIKQNTIRYVLDEELEEFKKIQGIRDYIIKRKKEIDEFNEKRNIDKSLAINGRNFTNAGLFRRYAQWYIDHHPGVDKKKIIMLRQLDPTPHGIPFEVYLFANTVNWIPYEGTMADIFDHLIAAVPYFGLEIYESPTGTDLDRVSKEQLNTEDLNQPESFKN